MEHTAMEHTAMERAATVHTAMKHIAMKHIGCGAKTDCYSVAGNHSRTAGHRIHRHTDCLET